jgi:hypothetical protein
MPASPSKVVRRQLIRPSNHIPWSADVVSAVPKELLLEQLDTTGAVVGAICPGWTCLANRQGKIYVWQPRTTNLSEPLEPPKEVVTIYSPDLVLQENDPPPLLALTSVDRDSVHLYAAHPTTGALILRKIARKDLRATKIVMPRSHTTKTRIPIALEDDASETLTALTASSDGVVVLGTSAGNIYWVTYTAVPVGLHVQKVVVQAGLWNRLFSSTSSPDQQTKEISHLLPISSTNFRSVGKSGTVVDWKVTQTVAAAHHVTFEATALGSIASDAELVDPTILRATLATDNINGGESSSSIHCIVRATTSGESKLFWLESTLVGGRYLEVQRSHWLSRFPVVADVQVLGLAAADNGNVYAACQANGITIVMVLLKDENIIHEVDLPTTQIPSLLPNIFVKDLETHGCFTVASSGIGLRVRYLPNDSPQKKRARLSSSERDGATTSNPALVQTLTSHLRSAFWQSYQDVEMIHLRSMPPSLSQAQPVDLEQAIIAFFTELQHKGDASSAQNPLEWHTACVKLLQQGGLYRSFSLAGRWKLLAIGQELAVFKVLSAGAGVSKKQSGTGTWINEQLSNLQSFDICDWLLDVQTSEMQGGWQHGSIWSEWLCMCLEAATNYREERAGLFYDVNDEPPTKDVCMWLSHPSLQTVLMRQMEYWKRDSSGAHAKEIIETVVQASLRSYSESCRVDDGESKDTYAKVKALAVYLLRKLNKNGDDELAFDLSIQYHYFDGLCRISVDHEKKRDAKSYSLDPLFASMDGTDLQTGFTFAQFVLQWHTDAGLYGHVINYGRHSTKDLNIIMKTDERLRPYRWIQTIRQGDFTGATESFLANCEPPEATFDTHKWALSIAKLSNKLEVTRNTVVVGQQRDIERKLELVYAQQMLLEGQDEKVETAQLWPPEKLIELAMEQLENATTKDDRVRLCLIGLAICASIDDPSKSHTTHVWAQSLQLDSDVWLEWIRTQNDLTDANLRELALDSTVFGGLIRECRTDASLQDVTYGRHIEHLVMEKMGNDNFKNEMCRLLRSVCANSDIMAAQTLLVSSY